MIYPLIIFVFILPQNRGLPPQLPASAVTTPLYQDRGRIFAPVSGHGPDPLAYCLVMVPCDVLTLWRNGVSQIYFHSSQKSSNCPQQENSRNQECPSSLQACGQRNRQPQKLTWMFVEFEKPPAF